MQIHGGFFQVLAFIRRVIFCGDLSYRGNGVETGEKCVMIEKTLCFGWVW